jgi:hypothetical protein
MKFTIFSLLVIALFLTGCGSTQKVIGFWQDPDAGTMGPYTKVFVIVLSQNHDANYFFESEIARTLVSRGYKVVTCNDMFPPDFALSKGFTRVELADAIKKAGCDAVMTLALLDSKVVETYHPGTSYYPMNYGYYGSYYGYYDYYYPQVYSPGYYSVDKTFYLETNLFDVATDKLLWSLQSEASNPKDQNDGFQKYSVMLINHLKTKGLAKK